jgi:NodT family efflux transporter outer membrane factor (OMF) lipoprotein
LVSLLALAALQTGCAYTGGVRDYVRNGFKVGPEYCKPAAPIADDWIDRYNERVRQELPEYTDWWNTLNDPVLTQLINDMYGQNLTLRVAGTRVLQARQQLAIAVGSLAPQVQQKFGEYTHSQLSRNSFPGNIPGSPITPPDLWTQGLSAAWELDVWGRFRRNIEAENASLDATIEGYDAVLLSLLAETAASYVELRTTQERLQFARKNVEVQEGSLNLAEIRFRNGATTELDVTQARVLLQNTRELIPALETLLRLSNNQLCVLLGIPPRDLTAEVGTSRIPVPPPTVAVGVPANLLRRRPDVREAERQVAAQSARIGVAVTDLLPHFSIRGAIQMEATKARQLFDASSLAGVIAPGFSWDFLNYGRLLNNVRLQDARFQQLAIQYQQTVLEANAEAENAIVSFLKSLERLEQVDGAVKAAERSVQLALTQYREGATDFNRVFTLQDILVQQQDRLAVVRGDVAQSYIAIYKALGGGWQIRLGMNGGPRMGEAVEDSVMAPEELPEELPEVPATDDGA